MYIQHHQLESQQQYHFMYEKPFKKVAPVYLCESCLGELDSCDNSLCARCALDEEILNELDNPSPHGS